MSGQPEVDATVEPSDGTGRFAPSDRAYEKSDFLAGGRYSLTDADIHSRANVRHLMARSDALDEVQTKFDRLQNRHFELNTELSVIKARAERSAVYDHFITFCNSAGFAATGYAVSFLTVTGGDKTLPAV
jgi:hypothetical protein